MVSESIYWGLVLGKRTLKSWVVDRKIKGQPIYDAKDFKNHGEMISFLREKQSGTIKNAFFKSQIGNIDLIWYNKQGGIYHLFDNRKRSEDKVEYIARNLPKVISNGVALKNGPKEGISFEEFKFSS